MLDRWLCLVFFLLVTSSHCSPLYPGFGYDELPVSGKAMSFQLRERYPVQSRDLSLEEQEGFLTDPTEKRAELPASTPASMEVHVKLHTEGLIHKGVSSAAERHADAIFTNTYRKFLGQVSARKFLQTIMGKRLGHLGQEDEGQQVLTRRQSDSILNDNNFHKQMGVRNILAAILSNLSIEDLNSDPYGDYAPSLSGLLKL